MGRARLVRREQLSRSKTVYAVNGLGNTAYYASAATTAVDSTSYVGIAFIFAIESQAVASANRNMGGNFASNVGMWMRTGGTNATLAFLNLAGNTTPTYTIAAGDVGKVFMAVGYMNPNNASGNLGLIVNKQAALTTALTAGGVGAAKPMYLGRRSDGAGTGAGNIRIAGMAEFTCATEPSLSNVSAWMDSCKVAGDIVDAASGLTITNSWSVKRSQSGSAPATIVDNVGSATLTATGSPTLAIMTNPVWAF